MLPNRFLLLFGSRHNDALALCQRQLAEAQESARSLQTALAASEQQRGEAEATVRKLGGELAVARDLLAARPDSLPPDHLQVRQVGGVWGRNFYTTGGVMLNQIAAAFRELGRPLEDAAAILDFGCGCGRVCWNFQQFPHKGEVWGCDIDAEAIAWDRVHLGHIGQFFCNPVLPPLRFPDGHFDAIYMISVFTHLPEEMQFAWLAELRRVLRPGGVMLVSLHGSHYWANGDPWLKGEVTARGFAYCTGTPTAGLPDFYMVAYHAVDYVRARWSRFFEVVEVKEKYIYGVHDAAILRRRAD